MAENIMSPGKGKRGGKWGAQKSLQLRVVNFTGRGVSSLVTRAAMPCGVERCASRRSEREAKKVGAVGDVRKRRLKDGGKTSVSPPSPVHNIKRGESVMHIGLLGLGQKH